ncbi:MAG: PorP/SprF family type IX secretion system membrane protein [Bacteroidales bacterium]|nr:PorP/SprF family type IX secretion system membrane protein [Bacteroidales bacterium]MDY0314801.1 PorP/SprF family type IX secretion system membrane protein [Bacteroidales bacterium]NLB85681.1 PorP/SprF family type IX secretion system membrane protein [Bacteroidales bacterium]
MKKIFIIIVIFSFGSFLSKLYCQDIHFSQFTASPLSLNPAETGFFDANWRFTNNYRTQWATIGTPYRSISVGFDKAIHTKKAKHFGLGAFFINDHSGSSNLLVNKIFINAAYIISLNENNFLSLGAQLGFVTKDFSLNDLSLPSQFNENTGLFDSNLANNLISPIDDIKYLDVNLGIKYQTIIKNISPHFGLSFFHVNNPKETFINGANRLAMRTAFNSGIAIAMNKNIDIIPNVLVMYHKKTSDFVLGGIANFKLNPQKQITNIFAGIYERNSLNNADAIILTAGLGIYGFDLGFSYDVNVSALKTATKNRGAFEVSLIYKHFTQKIKSIAIPCDRY